MRALKLDFVRRPNPHRWFGFILLAAGMVAAAYLAQAYLTRAAELESLENNYRSLQKAQHKQADSGTVKTAEWEHLQAELKAANRVITRLALPWDALFRAVEVSVDEQVALLSVEPDTEKRELRIVAEAKHLDAMLEYVRRVQTIALFKDAYVLSHQIQQQDPQKPVRFVINAQWLEVVRPPADASVITMVGGPD